MPQVDVISEHFIVADPAEVAAAAHEEQFWGDLWPGAHLTVFEDRGRQGLRWNCSGSLVGSCEVWLEEHSDGVIVHCYLRADLPPGRSAGTARREIRRREVQVNEAVFALKDRIEGDRPAAGGRRGRSSATSVMPTRQG